MPKGLISKDYVGVAFVAVTVVVLLLVTGLFAKPSDWAGWIQAIGLIVGLAIAVAVPAVQKRQEMDVRRKEVRDRETGYARRMQYLCGELNELLAKITVNLVHLRAADRHRLQRTLEDYLHRLFESHKLDQNDDRVVIAHELRLVANDLIEELESGRSDRVVLGALEKRLQKLAHRCQINATVAERT
ncbi:hypothetical protein ACIPL1_17700 [Pseudomonas sp. NPDC090202]|uniref:hypothetical protein n=1 Tax=unclassified Pseudomonas TaxID=196821 RepID=UPI0037FBC6F3